LKSAADAGAGYLNFSPQEINNLRKKQVVSQPIAAKKK
jgi:hypothetical protein